MLGGEEQYYLFIDEVQNVSGFESVIHAYAEEFVKAVKAECYERT